EALDRVKSEKENIQLTVEKLEHASKNVTKIIDSQVNNKVKSGLGYNTTPPPYRGIPKPPGIDLEHSGLPEFQLPKLQYGVQSNSNIVADEPKKESKCSCKTLLFQDKVSFVNKQVMSKPEVVKKARTRVPKIVKHNTDRPKTNKKYVRQPVRYCEQYRVTNKPRGNQRNWNNLKSYQLGDDFAFHNKACFICGSFDHLAAFCNQWVSGYESNRVNYKRQTPKSHFHSNSKRSKPKTVTKAVPADRAKNVPTERKMVSAEKPYMTVYPKSTIKGAKTTFKHASNIVQRPIQTKAVVQKQVWRPKGTTSKLAVSSAKHTAAKGNKANAVKASACWILKSNVASTVLKRLHFIDARGRSKSVLAWIPKEN
ncbi:MAG: hypothetical protein J6586_11070, partial [Snodgrassella sp.]|nr:hypothetical protein [Snodgrassella sp.]